MRRRIIALALAATLAVGGGAAYAWESRLTDEDAPFVGYPTAQEVSSWQLMRGQYERSAERGESVAPVFGSSELNPGPAGFSHPGNLLAPGTYDVDALMVGRAGCADLWQAIEIGAFASVADAPRRVVLFPSIQWFMTYRRPARDFPDVYSSGAFEAFMANGDISDGLKRRVAQRAAEYGAGEPANEGPVERIVRDVDEAARTLASDVRLAHDLAVDGRGSGVAGDATAPLPPRATGGPDWDAVFTEADRTARAQATGNDLGMNDAWYGKHFKTWLEGANKSWKVRGDEYFSSQEFEDFKMVLDVCRETGVEPLIVIQPVKGAAYDQTVYTCEVRQQYYRMVRDAAADAGFQVADFSGHEYDRYFLRDYSHPSELGSAYYSKAIYTFLKTGYADTGPSGDVLLAGV